MNNDDVEAVLTVEVIEGFVAGMICALVLQRPTASEKCAA